MQYLSNVRNGCVHSPLRWVILVPLWRGCLTKSALDQRNFMDYHIETILHSDQRYETVGDWQVRHGFRRSAIFIKVSSMVNEDYEFLVGLHEMIEAHLCFKRGITQQAVDQFDMDYERNRKEGDESEPGDQPSAPYYKEYQFALKLERLMSDELGVNWDKYEETLNSL